MRNRRVLIANAAALICAALLTAAPNSFAQQKMGDVQQTYAFVFQDADLALVAEEVLGQALGVSYTIDAGVNPKVSFRVQRRMSKLELLSAFETALAANDIVLVRAGESFILTSRQKARTTATLSGSASQPNGYGIVSVPLANSRPTDVARALKSMGGPDIVVLADDDAMVLMLGGTTREIQNARGTIASLDRRVSTKSRWIDLRNASSDVVARELSEILTAKNLTAVKVASITRLRGLMLFAPTEDLIDEASQYVVRLDVTSAEGDDSLWYYRPKNVAADSLSATLNRVLGNGDLTQDSEEPSFPRAETRPSNASGLPSGAPLPAGLASAVAARPTPQSTPIISTPTSTSLVKIGEDPTRVAVDRESNTLVISSPPYRKAELLKLLQELDVRPRQVLIEASVLEVTLTEESRFGVDWSFINGRTKATLSGDQSGAVAPSYPGLAVTYLTGDITAAIDALGSKAAVQVVSSPKIIALDNRSARLQIGDQVPVATQTQQSSVSDDSPRLVNIEYRNTGVILDVTPRVTGDGTVTLLISQEVSSVAKTTTSGIDSPTIQQRRFESSLLLNSGATVALGGLISSNANKNASGTPILMDIPFLGTLFKSEGADERRTELIVLLSASILADPEASSKATEDLSSRLKEIQNRGLAPR